LKLVSLQLTNFKGVREFILDANGGDVSVYGDNATGKTTIADAWFWCLFGKTSDGRTDADIKTYDADGEPFHGLNHTVELVLAHEDAKGEKHTTFTRSYHEVYKTQRGSQTEAFSGHTTDYWINSVPVSEKEYAARVASILSEKTFRLLSDPRYFANLPWQKRREMLVGAFCPNITDGDVIASDPALKDLTTMLGLHSPDERRKIVAETKKKVNEELKAIPARIDEVNRSVTKPTKPSDSREALDAEITAKQNQRAEIQAGGGTAEIRTKIAEIDAAMTKIVSDARIDHAQATAAASAALATHKANVAAIESRIRTKESELAAKSREVDAFAKQITTLTADHKRESAVEFTGATDCPSCGQSLPAERVQAVREAFNEAKAQKLAKIIEDGKAARKLHTEATAAAGELLVELTELQAEREAMPTELQSVPAFSFEPTDEHHQMQNTKAELQDRIAEMLRDTSAEVARVDVAIGDLRARLAAVAAYESAVASNAAAKTRIEELTNRLKELGSQAEALDREAFLLELFTRAKAGLVTDRINSKFELARFRMFDTQVNGGIVDCCEITYEGVPWAALNTGSQMNVGLDIIDAIADAIGSGNPPIFIDNAESVTAIRPTAGQQIRLIVSAGDSALRAETDRAPSAPRELAATLF
jgi:chromosome segregation ATPase